MKLKPILFLLFACFLSVSLFAQQMPLVYDVEHTAPNYPKPAMPSINDLPVIQALPDPFEWSDGRGRIENLSDWKYRRAEIGAEIQNYEIGEKPPRPDTITASYYSGVLTVVVTVNGKTLTLTSQVVLPEGSGPFPAIIGMNSSSGTLPTTIFSSRNIARITYSHNQVTTYGTHSNNDPYYQLYPHLNVTNTGQYSAWAWGVSRLIDGLELVQDVLPIDLKRLAVAGCSYAGKMAIFAGAFDERIALTFGIESGGGGYTTWRYSEEINKIESVETLGKTNYSWFKDDMMQFSSQVSKLPHDHHELMAMVAPRALFVTGNPGWVWLADESGHVGSNAAKKVWEALGVPDRFGYSLIGGHNHCQAPTEQIPQIEAFVDKFLLGIDTVNTNVATSPYTTNLTPWITWSAPTLSHDTSNIYWTTLNYPADSQIGLDTTITFRWNKIENAEKYLLQISLDPGFKNIALSDSTTTDTVKTINGLLKFKKYYWRVKGTTSTGGVGLWSNPWSFITASLPAAPQLVSATPYQNRADYFTFKWRKIPEAEQYLVQVSKDEIFSTIFRSSQTSDTVRNILGFTQGEKYYWRVQGKNLAGSGAWSAVDTFTANVSTGIKQEKGIPTEYSLSQNYPNPFNPTTKIQFALPKAALIKLSIYDLLGREVQIVLDKELKEGYYEVSIDAGNLSSGIYFYKIQAGNFLQTKKMVVAK